ncbi:MAG: SUMF1/EgtB/PvdO family nonheme iron enzyme [Planctomycetaceae bacterium]
MSKALKLNLAELPARIGRLLSTAPNEPSLLSGLVERDEQMRLMLLAALAGEHALLIGPPGTAKSLLARRLRLAFRDAIYFERLLTQFSVPEDLFGPYRLTELENDNFVRKTTGYLPTADVAFLDEIFKSNPAILNALLSILNERLFHNDSPDSSIPLKCLIGASNEVPEPGELDALYDRFLVRCDAGYVNDFRKLLRSGSDTEPTIPEALQFTTLELEEIKESAQKVTVPNSVDSLLELLRARARELQLDVSDRRWLKVRKFLQTAALTNGRQSVSPLDVLLVPHGIWSPRQVPPPRVDPKAKEKAPPSPSPTDVRDGLGTWLQEHLWEATPAKPGLLGEQLVAWETKLQEIAKQAAAKRDPNAITSGVRETQSLQKRIGDSLTELNAEAKSLNLATTLKAASTSPSVPASRWLAPPVALSALKTLDETQQLTSEWKARVDQVAQSFQQLQKDSAAEIKPPATAAGGNKSNAKGSGKSSGAKPDPYDFGHTPKVAMSVAPKVQQEWADYLSNHPAVDSSKREVTHSFQKNKHAPSWTMDFQLIPPGEVKTDSGMKQIANPFLLGKFHVTREQWEEAALGPNPWNKSWSGKNLPVDSVSWLMCIEFCNKLSEIQRLQPAYSGSAPSYTFNPKADGYRLPTEWEWEYACRAGTATIYWCGDSDDELKKIAWYDANSGSKTHPVDEKNTPNPFGLVGMHGNLWEWCWDPYDGNDQRRVLRGGPGITTPPVSPLVTAAATRRAAPATTSVVVLRGPYSLTLEPLDPLRLEIFPWGSRGVLPPGRAKICFLGYAKDV